jgi:hypothetical protein
MHLCFGVSAIGFEQLITGDSVRAGESEQIAEKPLCLENRRHAG